MTFSLANPGGHTLKISKGPRSTQNDPVFDCADLSKPSGAGMLVAENMAAAIEAAGNRSDITNLVIRSDNGSRNLYTIFCSIDNYQSDDLIKVSLKNTADSKIITEGTLSHSRQAKRFCALGKARAGRPSKRAVISWQVLFFGVTQTPVLIMYIT